MNNVNNIPLNRRKQKSNMFYYILESFIYKVSDHSPIKFNKRSHYGKRNILSVSEGRQQIISLVNGGKPFMVGRYGTSEGRVLSEYHQKQLGLRKEYSQKAKDNICICSGFFPNDNKALDQWGRLMTELSSQCDIYGVMNFYCEGWTVENLLPNAVLMPNSGIATGSQGYGHILENRKILVVHPMDKTINEQYYSNREHIFPNTNALPCFDLKTFKAVNTLADQTDDRFSSWFDALDYMTEEISKIDFEIAIVGCGAYGFPLAARIKQMGKSAIHMGGAVQHLFGIKSERGLKNPTINKDYNEFWVFPDESERPKGAEKVEGGCYWAPKE